MSYDFNLKALHLWIAGSDSNLAFALLYELEDLLSEAFPLAFDSCAVVRLDDVYAVITDEGCRCELEGMTGLIDHMLAEYPGYFPERLNAVAEQAAQQFGGHVVRYARPDTEDPYVMH